ncbi:hypothetical protein SeMB42_g05791 [Synchytrium endobioticum]|nr:hypothetical protein SeMB42_g05791 [Synchytrium endobioticum]
MTAGLISTLATNPLWVVRTRFMTQSAHTSYNYRSIADALCTMVRVEGFKSLYKGLGPSLVGVSHVCVQFPTYEKLKQEIQERAQGTVFVNSAKGLSSIGILTASAISKMLASTVAYPHEVLRTRLHTQTHLPGVTTTQAKYRGLVQTFRTIVNEEGGRALYKGLSTNLLRTVPAAAITLLTYETLADYLDKLAA